MRAALVTALVAALAAAGGGCGRRDAAPSGAAQGSPAAPRTVSPLFDPARAPELLDDPARDRWQQPARIVRTLRLKKGDVVADVGAGSGYLMQHLSGAVGPGGMVVAEEIQEAFLPELQRRATRLGNVQVVLGTAENPRFPRRDIDYFVLLTVYHEVRQPVPFLRALHRYAKPGARLAVIDFDAGRKGGPPAPVGHEVAERAVIAEAREAGWEVAERHDFLPSQFFLVFRRGRTGAGPGAP